MLQLSHLKLIAGVVFALFVLTACGGGGDSATPAAAGGDSTATDTTTPPAGTTPPPAGSKPPAAVACTADEFDNGTECVAKITDASCTNHTDSPYNNVNPATNTCHDPYTRKELDYFDTGTEYDNSKNALEEVNAAEAYVNIEALIDADYGAGNIKQGGEGQIISVASQFGFNTTHQEFGSSNDGAAFVSIYDASITDDGNDDNGVEGLYTSNADIIDGSKGKCSVFGDCEGTIYAALIAGRKGAVATNADTNMHGIAYNAKINAIITDKSATQLSRTLSQGVSADIIAMNHVWYNDTVTACSAAGVAGTSYNRPLGLNVTTADTGTTCATAGGTISTANSAVLVDAELNAWKAAVTDSAIKKTIMVFTSGFNKFNSENGSPVSGSTAVSLISTDTNGDGTTNVMDANIPGYRAAYPAIDTSLSADRWLVVTGLNTAGDTIHSASNGCGAAMSFCLAAVGESIGTPNVSESENNGYEAAISSRPSAYASSTVAGSLAVLKGAFPNAEPEQLTRLVLQTSTYIPLVTHADTTYRSLVCKSDADSSIVEVVTTCSAGFTHADHPTDKEADGTTAKKLYVNPVYGYGRLNLEAATAPSITISSLSIGNNESIGVLWKDTQLTLSSHFGTGLDSVSLGIGDEYGRHFTVKANKITSAPVAVASLDEYMANMLADNVQSEKLGGQAKLNYSNTAQPWMNLEYRSGKATSKIAFQDSYKISPLNDSGATTVLRANHIRPASNNIGMMDIDYALNGALSLSSYAARGEYDTGYKFDELGTDFDVNYKKSHLNIAIGNIREHDQFLGTHTTGGYALNAPTVSRFTDVTYGHDVGNRFNIYANYINYETDVDMLHDQFASIDGLQADQYQVGFTGKNLMSDDDNLNVALITKLGVTDGALNQNTTLGYTADGAFNDVSQSYDLAVSERHQQFEITYQGKIYQNSDKVSTLKDNRFFTTIRVDQNLNHVQGASQTEIVTGMQARF